MTKAMTKIDTYLRSIERFGATGALLVSGHSVTLRFPTGDRHATQVTPHELLVALVREVAPPAALAALESDRAVRFLLDGATARFVVAVVPGPKEWQVAIDVEAASAPAAEPAPTAERASAPARPLGEPAARARGPLAVAEAERIGEMAAALSIERTPFDDALAATGSGSALLDRLLSWARAHRASDLILTAGTPAMARIDGAWVSAGEHQQLDADVLSRELGVMAPAHARAAWSERGEAWFGAGDAAGRMRVVLGRDAKGPRATLRLLRAEPPAAEQLGVPAAALAWLRASHGLILVAGGPGSGKSTTLSALVRELAHALGQFVVTVEDPIELVQRPSALISQREVGAHVSSLAAGVRGAMRQGARVLAVARCDDADTTDAVAAAVDAGHLVLLEVSACSSASALARVTGALPAAAHGRQALAHGLRGVLLQIQAPRRDRTGPVAAFEVLPGSGELSRIILEQRWDAVPELVASGRGAGAVLIEDALAALVQRGLAAAPRDA